MIEFHRKMGPFVITEIWFSDDVYDVDGVDAVQFRNTTFSGTKEGFTQEISKTLVLDLRQSIEEIWNSMEKRARRDITKVLEDKSIVIRFDERIAEFDAINREFRKRKGLPPMMISPEEMKKNYLLATYEKDGVVLGGHLCIKDERNLRQLISCNSMTPECGVPPNIFARANKLSIWEMMKHSKEEGIEEYDFGGYATGELGEELKGINEFKMSFGGHLCDKNSYIKNYSKTFSASKSVYLSAISAGQRIRNFSKNRKKTQTEKEPEKPSN
jgi:hypothetical protein